MSVQNPDQLPLVAFLKSKNPGYLGKLLELREAVQGWLSYIPQSFPHYTKHTVDHSDQIILQASKLLFGQDDPARPVVPLSGVEAYMLSASAYLHDAGMVVSDSEKVRILQSEEWRVWTGDKGPGAKRWQEIVQLRQGQHPPDENIRNFLVELQTRYLIAEFVRRAHHTRAASFITQHQPRLGRYAFDDPTLVRAISNICLSHGLKPRELDDKERYPTRADFRGEQANVRFIAIILRLADLLDMSYDRACPLLLNAACPIPSDSLAHWTKYQRIVWRLTAPDRIELTAECENQDEHRFLQDWCQWLVEEVQSASVLMARSERHGGWQPPRVSLEGPEATIRIRPAPTATYIPLKWTFALDQDAVFERLVYDVSDSPVVFIRELVQNALDAMRCQLYADLAQEGVAPPPYPTNVDEVRRQRYPLRVNLKTTEKVNPISEEVEVRQVLSVDDCGIGMDREIIQDYLLQVGRSYYTTEEFKRSFGFVPTSRFGMGFLTVFAVSDYVKVESIKPSSSSGAGPIALTLTGPRNYILVERGQRSSRGTRIDVLLRESLPPGRLTSLLRRWCRRVEFPIIVDDLGVQSTFIAERPEDYTYEIPDVTKEGAVLAVRAFPLNRAGIEGEVYIFARVDEREESWAAWDWARYSYPQMHPQAVRPKFPGRLECLHGIAIHGDPEEELYVRGPVSTRLDYRKEVHWPTLSRTRRRARPYEPDPEVASRLEEILEEHLRTTRRATGPGAWIYRQSLVEHFPLYSFWSEVPKMISIIESGQVRELSLKEIQAVDRLVVVPATYVRSQEERAKSDPEVIRNSREAQLTVLLSDDLHRLSDWFVSRIFEGRSVSRLWWLHGSMVAVDWALRCETSDVFARGHGLIRITSLPSPEVVALRIHRTQDSVYEDVLLNADHPFASWIVRLKTACAGGLGGLRVEQFDTLVNLLDTAARYGHDDLVKLNRFLSKWKHLTDLPADLRPPQMELQPDSFRLRRHEEK